MNYLKENIPRAGNPQSLPMRGDQVANSAGGYTWQVDDFTRLRRFLILGSEGGSYYASERKLTLDNMDVVKRCAAIDPARTLAEIIEVSENGRAPKNDVALYALAVLTADERVEVRQAAAEVLPRVARIGTHLFQFATFVESVRGWGPTLRRAVGDWYEKKDADKLAYDLVKYRQRDGWSHRDMLRLSHPKGSSPAHARLYDWVAAGSPTDESVTGSSTPSSVVGFAMAQNAGTPEDTAKYIRNFNLPREAVNTDHLKSPVVWDALLHAGNGMPLTALIRNLANMTRNGLVAPGSDATKTIVQMLADADRIKKSRVHPISVLAALLTYASGRSVRGQGDGWSPVAQVIDALDDAFYLAFGNVEPTGGRTLLALDVSGSMDGGMVGGVMGLTPRLASAAMAMVTARVEEAYECIAFTDGLGGFSAPGNGGGYYHRGGVTPFPLSAKQRLDDVVKAASALPFGGTDCSLPMLYAAAVDREIDTFITYTDSETWAGAVHPAKALADYRHKTGINARLIVVAMQPNEFSIADPRDPGMLDCCGFDTGTPQIISDFASGRI